jgi:hypothetical protein
MSGLLENAGIDFRYLLQDDTIVPDPGIEKLEKMRDIADIVNAKQPLSAADRKNHRRPAQGTGSQLVPPLRLLPAL